MSITFVDGVTPLNAVNMNHLVQDNEIVAAATRIVQNMLAPGDTQPAFRILGDGRMDWGAGGSTAPDTTLYRSGVGTLKTDGYLAVQGGVVARGATAANTIFFVNQSGDTNDRFIVSNNGYLQWGPGNAALDTNLYRHATATLRTGGSFVVDNDVYVDFSATGKRLYFGSAYDAYLYREAASPSRVRCSGDLFADTFGGSDGAGGKGWRGYTRTGNRISFDWSAGTIYIFIDGTQVKSI